MKRVLCSIILSGLVASSLFADTQLTLIDKDGNQTSQCVKSYSFSNNLESLNSSKYLDIYSETETLTNKIYLGKPVYRKVVNFSFNASGASKTSPVQVEKEIVGADKLFIVNSEVTSGSVHSAPLVQIASNTYWWIRGIDNKVQFRTYANSALSANAVVEYTKTADVAYEYKNAKNSFKSYIHYVASSSATDEVTTVDLEETGVRLLKDYTYDSTLGNCTANN